MKYVIVYFLFSRTLARETSEVCRPDTSPYISPLALGPVASSQNIVMKYVMCHYVCLRCSFAVRD